MIRKYGTPPYTVAVLHGGPGAPGYMAPVARELQKTVSVLEPLQTKDSLQGQIEELKEQLLNHGHPPVTLIGSSWGAILALFLAAEYQPLVKKIILIGSGVFDAESAAKIETCRLERLTEENWQRYEILKKHLEEATPDLSKVLFREWPDIFFNSDVLDPLTRDLEILDVQYDIFSKVWPDFVALRDEPGRLKKEFSKIAIPTVVIHGDYDPHPIEGIQSFLESCLENVRFHILSKCGHYPWIERQAREKFFEILQDGL